MATGLLKYVGEGEFLMGVPARDLTPQDIATLEATLAYKDLTKFLVNSGLYEEVKPKAATAKAAGEVSRGDS